MDIKYYVSDFTTGVEVVGLRQVASKVHYKEYLILFAAI
jgi:hypothetical protein